MKILWPMLNWVLKFSPSTGTESAPSTAHQRVLKEGLIQLFLLFVKEMWRVGLFLPSRTIHRKSGLRIRRKKRYEFIRHQWAASTERMLHEMMTSVRLSQVTNKGHISMPADQFYTSREQTCHGLDTNFQAFPFLFTAHWNCWAWLSNTSTYA